MALSKKRIIFRRFLYVILAFSLVFAGTTVYYRTSYKRTKAIAPILFKIDVARYKAKAIFADEDEKYKIARKLYAFTMFSNTYHAPAIKMMDELIAMDNAEAMVFRAHLLIRNPDPEIKAEAIGLYERAARQHHHQAVLALYKIQGQ